MASQIMAMNAAGNAGRSGGSVITEERVAEIAANVVKSIPVQITEGSITEKQKEVQIREQKFSV
jgi:hypothetical protein